MEQNYVTVTLCTGWAKKTKIWQSYQHERDCLVHFLRLLAVCWPCTQSA